MHRSLAPLALLLAASCGGPSKPAPASNVEAADPEEPIAEGISDPDLAAVIADARSAAAASDYDRLRGLMADDFTFSFGDEASADGAIATWKQDAVQLPRLVALIDGGCVPQDAEQTICPKEALGDGYMDYRVGFAKRDAGWQMTFYVAGD